MQTSPRGPTRIFVNMDSEQDQPLEPTPPDNQPPMQWNDQPPPLPKWAPGQIKPWGFWPTMALSALCMFAMLVAQMLFLASAALVLNSMGEQVTVGTLADDSLFMTISMIVGAAAATPLVFWLTHMRRLGIRSYLGLVPLRLKSTLLGLLSLLGLLFVLSALVGDRSAGTEETNRMLAGVSQWWLVVIAVAVAAPVFEEILFRGFMFKGIVTSLGPVAAVLITAATWSVLHFQYNILGIGLIFTLGLFLGVMRAVTGSTTLAIFLHATVNSITIAQLFANPAAHGA